LDGPEHDGRGGFGLSPFYALCTHLPADGSQRDHARAAIVG
jgi:hypothetical protein